VTGSSDGGRSYELTFPIGAEEESVPPAQVMAFFPGSDPDPAGLAVGQVVEARYNGTRWRPAMLTRVGSESGGGDGGAGGGRDGNDVDGPRYEVCYGGGQREEGLDGKNVRRPVEPVRGGLPDNGRFSILTWMDWFVRTR
jgi:hypothetical protein